MSTSRWSFAVNMVSMLFICACEHGITIHAEVLVSPDVQALYSNERPGRILLTGSIPKTSFPTYSLGILCQPDAETKSIQVTHDGFGCAKSGEVLVSVVSLKSIPEGESCGLVTSRRFNPNELDEKGPTAFGKTAVFPDHKSSSGCSSGETTVQVILAPEHATQVRSDP